VLVAEGNHATEGAVVGDPSDAILDHPKQAEPFGQPIAWAAKFCTSVPIPKSVSFYAFAARVRRQKR